MTKESNTAVPKWRRTSTDEVLWAEWDGNFIAYHRRSGKTHFLNAASELLITEILVNPKDAESVADEFAAEDADDVPDRYLQQITSMLERLEQLGLVERV